MYRALLFFVFRFAAGVENVAGEEFDSVAGLSPQQLRQVFQHSPLPALPVGTSAVAADPRAARLGQFLFFDPRLSANGRIACATCHRPELGFSDGRPTAVGLAPSHRHTPSLWNVAYNRWYFWDGRADSLWSQALKPIESPRELGSSRLRLAHLVAADPELATAYETVFGALPELTDTERFPPEGRPVADDPDHPHHRAWSSMRPEDRTAIDRVFSNVGKAIAAYERRLVSRNSPFDVFVAGLRDGDVTRQSALSPAALRGLEIFFGSGQCRVCHSGPSFSDGEFHDLRLPGRSDSPNDPGRFEGIRRLLSDPFNTRGSYSDRRDGPSARRLDHLATGPQSWGRFKTPTLRNVALSPPYMHQGQLASLSEVIDYYSTLRGARPAGHHAEAILVERRFSPRQAADLIAFLQSLTDAEVDPALLAPPASPLP